MMNDLDCKPKKNKKGSISRSRIKSFLILLALFIVIGGGVLASQAWNPPSFYTATINNGIPDNGTLTKFGMSRTIDPSVGAAILKISNPSTDPWKSGESATGIEFEKANKVNGYIKSVHTRGAGVDHSASDAGLVFGTAPSSTLIAEDRMVIDSLGNVGIGTTITPAAKLEVNGNVKINTGGSANKAICWKADGKTLGYCSTAIDATGSCICN